MDGPKQVGTVSDIIVDGLSMAIFRERAEYSRTMAIRPCSMQS